MTTQALTVAGNIRSVYELVEARLGIKPTLEWHALASGSSSAVFVIEASIL